MRKVRLFILSIIFFSCGSKSNSVQDVSGYYESIDYKKEYSKLRRYIQHKLSYAYSGFTLYLARDSMYSMTTCSGTTHGRWLIEDNRVQFSCLDSTFKDSIRYVPFMSCEIVGDRLKYKGVGRTREGKKMRLLNILEKVGEPE